ncbi:adenosylcobinamide amidohydrolase [Methanocella sp. CWC-04]|uniref:Adenosylcobinamide amidohydrolase n=1 Tax=Methanooceanicella nereidis TaxID=2052831 RepID=A0AAP2RFG4_9EURY|nr:adenosylcobinamide amidohydrolase [Methanocella sp. CWC-04]MCD1296348.1 adenosylcobinamide amidohydrolase [Methanocella sp. CWC-04]
MRYYVNEDTLIIKGDLDGFSTGINGGRKRVRSIINHHVNKDFNHDDPVKYMDEVASKLGADFPYFGFMTAVYMENLCVVRDHLITAFITAGISNPCHDPHVPGTINIILIVHGKMSEGAIGSAVITATEAKAKALFEMGFEFTGTTTDAVAVLTEVRDYGSLCEPAFYEYSGTYTNLGQSIYRCVKKGVTEGIKRQHAVVGNDKVKSRVFIYAQNEQGPYWISHPSEANGKGKCSYYPCHYEGQDCTHCFCPLYPCEDPEFGKWILSTKGYPVWTCMNCTLLHKPGAAVYLAKNPGSHTKELKELK